MASSRTQLWFARRTRIRESGLHRVLTWAPLWRLVLAAALHALSRPLERASLWATRRALRSALERKRGAARARAEISM